MIIDLMPVILILVVAISMIFDVVNNMIIPLFVPFFGIAIRLLELGIFEREKASYYLFTAVAVFLSMLTVSYLGNLGGSDSIHAAMAALYLGVYGLYAVILAFMLSLPYAVWMKIKNKEKEYPFMPYILIGICIEIGYLFKEGKIWS